MRKRLTLHLNDALARRAQRRADAEGLELETLVVVALGKYLEPAAGRLLTPGEASDILGVQRETLIIWADNGHIESVRTPYGHRRYPVDEVLRVAREHKPGDRWK